LVAEMSRPFQNIFYCAFSSALSWKYYTLIDNGGEVADLL
jgi:hypothetical protein